MNQALVDEILAIVYQPFEYETHPEQWREQIGQLMRWSMNRQRMGDREELNAFYGQLDPKRLSFSILSPILRASFSAKRLLPAYEPFRIVAVEEAKARRPDDYKRIFIGLLESKVERSESQREWDRTVGHAFDKLFGIHPSMWR